MTSTGELSLAADFSSADRDQWLGLVDKVLKGADFDRKLVSSTYDGIRLQPLYTRTDSSPADEMPGQGLLTRGRWAAGPANGEWGLRQRVRHPEVAAANRLALEELEGGATSLELLIDAGGAGEVDGVVLADQAAFDRLVDGIYLELITVVLSAGSRAAAVAEWLIAAWDRAGVPAHDRHGNLGLDPVGVLARTGVLPQGIDAAFAEVVDLATRSRDWRHVRTVEIDTGPYVDAGASEGQELAAALATGVASLRAMVDGGLSLDDAAAQIGFTLSADADVFATIAKLRAMRRCWAHVITAAGGTDEAAAPPVSVRTARRMMSRRDPWVNMLRTTAACLAAGVGGASSVVVEPFDVALGLPGALGRRVARNTQLVLQQESNVARVLDPAGGSFFVERFTDELADVAWARFVEIEAAGGIVAALADGSLAASIAEVSAARARNISTRRDPLTGVSEFPNLGESLPQPAQVDVEAVRATAAAAWALPTPSGPATLVTPLTAVMLDDPFEELRAASDAHLAATGARPSVFLANLGPVATHTARATYAKNFFEAGGVEAIGNDGVAAGAEVGPAFAASGARIAVICSSDAVYETEAAAAASALKAAGAIRVYLAGAPGDRRAGDEAAGVDQFIHMGVDVLDALRTAHDTLGVAR